ncbi:MAG: lantibiotic transporter, partial [Firmicutes bacterium]|nr:lantibiotic transporter [Bacillota bacterium]
PRGKYRLIELGQIIAQHHLNPMDKLIGLIGDAGSGKSLLIKGMFPGLELTNDDEGINIRPLPILAAGDQGFFSRHTYHLDIRFELAFTQMGTLVEAVKTAIDLNKRVVIEHFELIQPYLGLNAEILIGIGEEVIVTRPNIFGPLPQDISTIVFESIKYRKMAHTAEDLTGKILADQYGLGRTQIHSDVKNGFVLLFQQKPQINLAELERQVQQLIAASLDVQLNDENHIAIGEVLYPCSCPRIHVRNTGAIENFRLVREFIFNPIDKTYALVGLIGSGQPTNINDLNQLNLFRSGSCH